MCLQKFVAVVVAIFFALANSLADLMTEATSLKSKRKDAVQRLPCSLLRLTVTNKFVVFNAPPPYVCFVCFSSSCRWRHMEVGAPAMMTPLSTPSALSVTTTWKSAARRASGAAGGRAPPVLRGLVGWISSWRLSKEEGTMMIQQATTWLYTVIPAVLSIRFLRSVFQGGETGREGGTAGQGLPSVEFRPELRQGRARVMILL